MAKDAIVDIELYAPWPEQADITSERHWEARCWIPREGLSRLSDQFRGLEAAMRCPDCQWPRPTSVRLTGVPCDIEGGEVQQVNCRTAFFLVCSSVMMTPVPVIRRKKAAQNGRDISCWCAQAVQYTVATERAAHV